MPPPGKKRQTYEKIHFSAYRRGDPAGSLRGGRQILRQRGGGSGREARTRLRGGLDRPCRQDRREADREFHEYRPRHILVYRSGPHERIDLLLLAAGSCDGRAHRRLPAYSRRRRPPRHLCRLHVQMVREQGQQLRQQLLGNLRFRQCLHRRLGVDHPDADPHVRGYRSTEVPRRRSQDLRGDGDRPLDRRRERRRHPLELRRRDQQDRLRDRSGRPLRHAPVGQQPQRSREGSVSGRCEEDLQLAQLDALQSADGRRVRQHEERRDQWRRADL